MSNPVRSYLADRKYADHVIAGGLAQLVEDWEAVVDEILRGDSQNEPEYLNDMDGRRILAEALAILPPDERQSWEERVQAADARIRSVLIPTAHCLWGRKNEQRNGYQRERDWWYYHRPPNGDPDWSWGDE